MTSALMTIARSLRPLGHAEGWMAAPPRNDAAPTPIRLLGVDGATRIQTAFGPVPAALLRPRDDIRLAGGGTAPLLAIRRLAFDADCLGNVPAARAVTISEGSLARGLPRDTVAVAPDQPVGWDGVADGGAVIQAVDLCGRPGIGRGPAGETVYHVLVFATPVTILAEGLPLPV